MRINLYRPRGNNSVQLVMTREALDAHNDLTRYLAQNGGDADNKLTRGMQLRIGFGTLTFTTVRAMLLPGAAERHYGTFEVLDYLGTICKINRVDDISATVPFSNGPDGYDRDLKRGYGVKPGLFRQLLAEAKAGYDSTSDR